MYYDYGFILTVLSVVSGIVWLIDIKLWKPGRLAAAEAAKKNDKAISDEKLGALLKEPIYVDYARSFFPILLIILILRSFLFEPFRIPSGSMMPTLLIGDFILVNKFNYGVRLPITHQKVLDVGQPERGDVMVFKNPDEPKIDYIKRVIGLPGDRIHYGDDKSLTIIPACNKQREVPADCQGPTKVPAPQQKGRTVDFYASQFPTGGRTIPLNVFTETLDGAAHEILRDPRVSEVRRARGRYQKTIAYGESTWDVPEGHYFVLGDNRDNSQDSRYWGFVPEELIVGQAVAVWMHIELTDEPVIGSWRLPTGIKFGRIGGIQ